MRRAANKGKEPLEGESGVRTVVTRVLQLNIWQLPGEKSGKESALLKYSFFFVKTSIFGLNYFQPSQIFQ